MKILTFLLAASVSVLSAAEPVSLFNGKNLDGWKSSANGDFPFWTVKDGVLRAQSSPGKQGNYLWTKKEYASFVLTLDFKYGAGIIDSGVMLRGENDQIQIGISGSLKRDLTAAPYIPGKGYPVESKEAIAALKKDDWNTLKIEAKGNVYKTWLNGVEGITYTSESAKEKGPLGLQIHPGNEMQIDFRNIYIIELK